MPAHARARARARARAAAAQVPPWHSELIFLTLKPKYPRGKHCSADARSKTIEPRIRFLPCIASSHTLLKTLGRLRAGLVL